MRRWSLRATLRLQSQARNRANKQKASAGACIPLMSIKQNIRVCVCVCRCAYESALSMLVGWESAECDSKVWPHCLHPSIGLLTSAEKEHLILRSSRPKQNVSPWQQWALVSFQHAKTKAVASLSIRTGEEEERPLMVCVFVTDNAGAPGVSWWGKADEQLETCHAKATAPD